MDTLFAFPSPDVRDAHGCGIMERTHGMTLRDWFAGQALAGTMVGSFSAGYLSEESAAGIAREAYLVADAMLAQREKGGDA